LARETAAVMMQGNRLPSKHDMSHSLEYGSWSRMKARCNNPKDHKYHTHGGRGITVCERWQNSFENFFADMGPKPARGYSVERVGNDGNYCPENCIWATPKIQGKNTRQNTRVTIDGKTLNLTDWCEELKIPTWKVFELCRPRGMPRRLPPRCKTTEEAIILLYRQIRGHAA
jgi:hypothetical protein